MFLGRIGSVEISFAGKLGLESRNQAFIRITLDCYTHCVVGGKDFESLCERYLEKKLSLALPTRTVDILNISITIGVVVGLAKHCVVHKSEDGITSRFGMNSY